MPINNTALYQSRQQITVDMLAELQGAISDAYIGTDGITYILFAIESGQIENVLLANQLLLQDCFPQTASGAALAMFGEMYAVPRKLGTYASGQVTLTGGDGDFAPAGSLVGAPRGFGLQPIAFELMGDAQIPSPGTPTPPVSAVNATAGNLSGTYEYAVTYVTASGESLQSIDSNATAVTAQQIDLTAIPIGGPGTISRKIYRQKNGSGPYLLVTTLANNTATTFTDNVLDASLGASAPVVDTAHSVTVGAIAESVGTDGNIVPGMVNIIIDLPSGFTDVTNLMAFTGGSDPEELEDYRIRLMTAIADPQTGSAADLESWAESIEGVESATVFENDNLGVPTNGHVTVRIAGPGGAIPDPSIVTQVYNFLKAEDIANITIHVSTFTPSIRPVTVDVTPDTTHTLVDITPSIQQAIADLIEGIPVGGTLYVAAIVDAVYGLPGVLDVVVTSPTTNQTSSSTQKFIPGTVTVT
jgi:uncharacterized phage protein gp47/JayE